MKNLTFILTLLILAFTEISAQVTYESNDPLFGTPLGFIGWNDNSNTLLDIRQNNIIRMRFSAELWPGYNNIGSVNNVNRIFVPSNSGVTQGNVFSILQIGDDLDNNLERDWMHKGITMGAGNDIFWSGIIQDPDNDGSQTGGDAVIAWGDNEDPVDFGPDNFRFLFISDLTSAASGPNSDQGRETMRITPQGNVGIGDSFSNSQDPKRRLVVHRGGQNNPQFRIAQALAPNIDMGKHADFQVDNDGILFIKPRIADTTRSVAIGFLNNELTDPTATTRLDVGGITRIRELPENNPETLIIGYSIPDVNDPAEDQFLGRLDFTGNNDDVLAGDGTWIDISSTGTSDLDWESDGTDVWTGHGLNGYPGGDVYIGSAPFAANARLVINDVASTTNRAGERILIDRIGGGGTTRGLDITLADLTNDGFNVGVEAIVRGGKFSVGGRFTSILDNNQSEWSAGSAGYAFGTTFSSVDVIGLYGYAENTNTVNTSFPIGVYGEGILQAQLLLPL